MRKNKTASPNQSKNLRIHQDSGRKETPEAVPPMMKKEINRIT